MLPALRKRTALPSFVDEFFGKDLLSDFFDDATGINTPAVNIIEGKNEFKIEVAAPGLSKDDFKIDLVDNTLEISSEKSEKKEDKDDRYMRREFSYTSFKRSFGLPDSALTDKIHAEHKDGILNIIIPKKEEAREKPPRTIKIS